MAGFPGLEKRKHPRISGRFVVSYRILEKIDNVDFTQTKNLSMGGMLLTTNKKFDPGTALELEIRLPTDLEPVKLIGKVVDSNEVKKDLIYDTRIEFLTVNEKHSKTIKGTVEHYLKKG